MTDAQVRQRLNTIAKLGNELDAEAKRRYGPNGNVFLEAEGGLHMMAGDCDGSSGERQEYVKVSATVNCRIGVGAW